MEVQEINRLRVAFAERAGWKDIEETDYGEIVGTPPGFGKATQILVNPVKEGFSTVIRNFLLAGHKLDLSQGGGKFVASSHGYSCADDSLECAVVKVIYLVGVMEVAR